MAVDVQEVHPSSERTCGPPGRPLWRACASGHPRPAGQARHRQRRGPHVRAQFRQARRDMAVVVLREGKEVRLEATFQESRRPRWDRRGRRGARFEEAWAMQGPGSCHAQLTWWSSLLPNWCSWSTPFATNRAP